MFRQYLAGIYLLKVKKRNTRTRCELCSKLAVKTPERRYGWLGSYMNYMFRVNNRNTRKRCEICSMLTIKTPVVGVYIVNLKHISHLALVFLILT